MKNYIRFSAASVLFAVSIFSSFSRAENQTSASGCATIVDESVEHLTLALNTSFRPQFVASWAQFEALPEALKTHFDRTSVLKVLVDNEMPLFQSRMAQVIDQITHELAAAPGTEPQTLIHNAFMAIPVNKVEALVEQGERLSHALQHAKVDLLRALGDRSLGEMQSLVYGADVTHPSAHSLIGLYMARAHTAAVTRTFTKGPDKNGAEGEPREVLQMSSAQMSDYLELFSLPEFLYHYHTPRQGTLYLAHAGSTGSYANMSGVITTATPFAYGSLLPMIVLSTREANRLTNFFELGKANGIAAQHPWTLSNYCATSGYNSCTHWFGNMPIGDRKVNSYVFPGKVDGYAHNSVGSGPQEKELTAFEHPVPLAKIVWQAPGHEQLADVLGTRDSNTAGEYANPGWVFHSLTGAVSARRVPLVFRVVERIEAAPSPVFDLQVNPI